MSEFDPTAAKKVDMFHQLPDFIQAKVRSYLEANDFPSAKEIYDQWICRTNLIKPPCAADNFAEE